MFRIIKTKLLINYKYTRLGDFLQGVRDNGNKLITAVAFTHRAYSHTQV